MSVAVVKQGITGMVLVLVTVAYPVSGYTQTAPPFCSLGEEKWIAGCEVRCTASWSGSSAKSCHESCSATAPPGWVIVDQKLKVISENNGGHSITKMEVGQKFDYEKIVQEAYSSVLDLAGENAKDEVKAKIREDMKSSLREVERFASTHQMIRVTVNARAHGTLFDRKRGWSDVKAELLCRCFAPENLQEQLAKKYGLQ